MKERVVRLKVNGMYRKIMLEPRKLLIEVLREDLGLTGSKAGCDDGSCGACTVLLDGNPVRSCLLLAVEVEGRDITTIEGVAGEQEMHGIQRAFVQTGAVQCGFCTPGMILSSKALLDRNPNSSEKEIREAISGNLCRCTGYVKIVEAIMAAAKEKRGE